MPMDDQLDAADDQAPVDDRVVQIVAHHCSGRAGNGPAIVENKLDAVLGMMNHKHTVVGLGDGGAHYGVICDASFPTFMLTYWTRDRDGERLSLANAVRALAFEPAKTLGLNDRGLVRAGYKADLNVIDYGRLALHGPEIKYDLPAGGRRLDQGATGYDATIVSGQVIRREDRATGVLPGRLVRGSQRAPA